MKKTFFIVIIFGFIIHHSFSQNTDSLAVLNQARADMQILCADSLAGRGYIADGHLKAARFLARRFQEIGLKPPNDGDYLWSFRFPLNVISSARLSINGKKLKVGRDFIPHPASSAFNQKKISFYDGAFALSAKDLTANAKGKFIGVSPGLPEQNSFSDKEKKEFAREDYKLAQVIQASASGALIWQEKLTASFAEEALPVPVFYIVKKDFAALKIKKIEVSIKAEQKIIESFNVVGFVEGTERNDTAVVVCAHYDHLGKIDEAIFYGANDNASGVSFMLGLAAALKKNPPKYRVYFIAFGAEETGLNGSRAYVENPLFPLSQTKIVLNFDLLGNGEEGVMAVGGKTFPAFYERIVHLNDQTKSVSTIAARPNAPNSDHYPFTQKGVPALFFYTMGGSKCYHEVCDKPEAIKLPIFYNFQTLILNYVQNLGR